MASIDSGFFKKSLLAIVFVAATLLSSDGYAQGDATKPLPDCGSNWLKDGFLPEYSDARPCKPTKVAPALSAGKQPNYKNMSEAEKRKHLAKLMEAEIRRMRKLGYFVMNPNLARKAFEWGAYTCVQGKNIVFGSKTQYKGGQCGEFGAWGQKWSRQFVKRIYGNNTIITDITIRSQFNPYEESRQVFNHNATRIITLDGERLVLDYWEGMQTGKAAVYKEEDWIKKWKNDAIFGEGAQIERSDDYEGSYLRLLRNVMSRGYTLQQAENVILNMAKDRGEQERQTMTAIVKSYRRKPWREWKISRPKGSYQQFDGPDKPLSPHPQR